MGQQLSAYATNEIEKNVETFFTSSFHRNYDYKEPHIASWERGQSAKNGCNMKVRK